LKPADAGVSGRNNKSVRQTNAINQRVKCNPRTLSFEYREEHASGRSRPQSLMTARLGGQGEPYRQLLHQLSGHLRGYFKSRLSRAGALTPKPKIYCRKPSWLFIRGDTPTIRPNSFTPWVYAIARYKLIDHLRHTRTSSANVSLDEAGDLMSEVDDQQDAEARWTSSGF